VESRKTVIEAIDKLPQRQKEAVLLHYYDRLNVSETAEVMGISQPAASIHLKEACQRIKRDIESSADRFIRAMHGFVAIPLGEVLSRSLYAEGVSFVPANQGWVSEAVAKCADFVAVGAVAAGGAASVASSAGGGSSISVASVAKTLLTIVAATTATLAITIGAIIWHSSVYNEPQNVYASGEVTFTSESELSFVNPTSASAYSGSAQGELYIHHWDIKTPDRSTILYSGKSSVIDEDVFALMHENEQYGSYEIVFVMEDANGAQYELTHNFYIIKED